MTLSERPLQAEAKAHELESLETLSPESLKGFEWWRRSLQYRTGLGLDEQGKRQFEHDYQNREIPEKCTKCETDRDWMLAYSPSARFMIDHINKLNDGPALSTRNIVCGICEDTKGGGFNPDVGILLCANWIRSSWQLEDVLVHELVHAYDHLKFKVDLTNLRHHACTEIRASMLSGECRILNEIRKTGLANFGGKFQECVRRRAVLSVAANPHCPSNAAATEAVTTVWKSCFNDTRPFERIYK